MRQVWTITLIFLVFIAIGCFGRWLTTREQGAANGALGGASVGGIVGAAVGHPGAGGAAGGALGLAPACTHWRSTSGPRATTSKIKNSRSTPTKLNSTAQEANRILRICLFLQGEIERLKRKNVWIRWQHSEGQGK